MRHDIDHSLGSPQHNVIIFDNVLTTGSHFTAMKQRLLASFPGLNIVGVFLARRVFPTDNIDDE